MSSILLGGGCFWCLEAVFQQVIGVTSVISGYAGGHVENPDYQSVCKETTGHAEVVCVEFNPEAIALADLLAIFFEIHDPTTLNRQGNDIGSQYRSVIYYNSPADKPIIEKFLEEAALSFANPIVTQIDFNKKFWPAESYHRDYFNTNRQQPYCQIVVAKKVKHFFAKFKAFSR